MGNTQPPDSTPSYSQVRQRPLPTAPFPPPPPHTQRTKPRASPHQASRTVPAARSLTAPPLRLQALQRTHSDTTSPPPPSLRRSNNQPCGQQLPAQATLGESAPPTSCCLPAIPHTLTHTSSLRMSDTRSPSSPLTSSACPRAPQAVVSTPRSPPSPHCAPSVTDQWVVTSAPCPPAAPCRKKAQSAAS